MQIDLQTQILNSFMKLSHLNSLLSSLRGFVTPKVLLEQYATDAAMAAELVTLVEAEVGLEGAAVLDLGCGCGMLSIAAAAQGAAFCLGEWRDEGGGGGRAGVEKDEEAALICKDNTANADYQEIVDVVVADALSLPLPPSSFDVALINPPFGTKKNEGIDMAFVARALASVRPGGSVFSLHKTSTRNFVLKKGRELGAETKAIAQMRWQLAKTYRFHKKNAVDIDVDVIWYKKLE